MEEDRHINAIKRLRTALKLYAGRENWMFSMSQDDKRPMEKKRIYREITSSDTYGFRDESGTSLNFGGKEARQALFATKEYDIFDNEERGQNEKV